MNATGRGSHSVAVQLAAIIDGLGGALPEDEQSFIGDVAYLYVRCQLFRELVDSLLSSTRENNRDSILNQLYRIQAEITNIGWIVRDLEPTLGKVLERLTRDCGSDRKE